MRKTIQILMTLLLLAFVFAACEGPMGPEGKQGPQGEQDEEHPGLVGIEISQLPYRTTYLMGEQVDVTGLQVTAAFSDGTVRRTSNYSIVYNTFTAGSASVNVISRQDSAITSSFNMEVLNILVDTGLPVIYIDTDNAQDITSKEDYVKMNLSIVSDNPVHDLVRTGLRDEIRGRGNSSWTWPKKPYRVRFAEKISLFGLEAARNWVLLANWKDYTLLSNTVALELGRRFGMPFTNHYVHVEVVLNGTYQGSYVLTEHIQVHEGRVDIDSRDGYLVELDVYFDEEPKFGTRNLGLPVMIISPETNYGFVEDSLNEFDAVVSAVDFPYNNYTDLTDLDSLVDFLLINEIVNNHEITAPLSTYLYRDKGGKIKWGPLWDFDHAYGLRGVPSISFSGFNDPKRRMTGGGFFSRFHNDPEFQAKYHVRWNEKIGDIRSMSVFISDMQNKLGRSAALNARRWYSGNVGYNFEVAKLKEWWNSRIIYLNKEINNYQSPEETQRLMIFQVYGTGTDTDGAVSHSFVELYNNSNAAIDLSNYSLHYANGHRSNEVGPVDSWTKLDLSGTIPAGNSYLIIGQKKNLTSRYQINEADADLVSSDFVLSNRAFKVALMSNRGDISAQNPFNTNGSGAKADGYVDMVSVINSGDIIDAYEGAVAEVISKQAAARRGSLLDSDNNRNDFVRIDYRTTGINDTALDKFRPRSMADGSWIPQF